MGVIDGAPLSEGKGLLIGGGLRHRVQGKGVEGLHCLVVSGGHIDPPLLVTILQQESPIGPGVVALGGQGEGGAHFLPVRLPPHPVYPRL